MNCPLIDSDVNSKFVFNLIPFPKKLFSLIPAPIVSPEVPNPAVTEISPVGLSSTLISISLNELFDPSLISVFTF